jgi:hypothetical protein
MNDEFRERAAELGDAALDFDSGLDRHAFIDTACGNDPALKEAVLKYIAHGKR